MTPSDYVVSSSRDSRRDAHRFPPRANSVVDSFSPFLIFVTLAGVVVASSSRVEQIRNSGELPLSTVSYPLARYMLIMGYGSKYDSGRGSQSSFIVIAFPYRFSSHYRSPRPSLGIYFISAQPVNLESSNLHFLYSHTVLYNFSKWLKIRVLLRPSS